MINQGIPGPVACTDDAKICPDGTVVGRVGPNCEFAPCPERGSDYCEVDDDCVCDGFDHRTGQCFVGNRNYYEVFVDKERDCPDFCTGIAGDMGVKCVENKCVIVKLETPLPVGPSMELIANPRIGEAPLLVNITAVLRNAEPNDARFYCVPMRWSFGDGKEDVSSPTCVPWFPEVEVPTRYSTIHRYERPGTYNVTFTLGSLISMPATVGVLPELFPPECDEDSDCAKAQCCHAADCVIKEKAPDCSRIMCTMECMPGTLDCGGSCACIAGRCTGQNFFPGVVNREKPMPWARI
ncbi:MAG: PKD domain-containing protein [Candidatus Woesearchaeota archaeon]